MHYSVNYIQEHPLPTYAELDEMILSTKILASNLIEALGIPKGFKEDSYEYAYNMAKTEKTAYNTEVQLQCHFWQGTSNGPSRELFIGKERKSSIISVNHKRRTHYSSAFAPIMRVAELEMLRDEFFDISPEKASADHGVLKLKGKIASQCSNYWVRNGISLISDHTSAPSVNTTAKEAGYRNIRDKETFVWSRISTYRASTTISLNQHYMTEVDSRKLCVVNCNGKTGFPLNAKPMPLPKKCDPSYELYASKVLVVYPKKVESSDSEAEAISGFSFEDRYICIGETNGGERIVSCSTTPGRAVGGVNVKTKNKVLDTLDFSF